MSSYRTVGYIGYGTSMNLLMPLALPLDVDGFSENELGSSEKRSNIVLMSGLMLAPISVHGKRLLATLPYRYGTARKMSVDKDATRDLLLLIQPKLGIV